MIKRMTPQGNHWEAQNQRLVTPYANPWPATPRKVPALAKVAAKAKAYRADLDAAYDTGYHDGYNAAKKIPRVPGAREAATAGYHTGQRDSRRAEKIEKRLAKGKKGGRK